MLSRRVHWWDGREIRRYGGRVKLLEHSVNKGLWGAARNKGFFRREASISPFWIRMISGWRESWRFRWLFLRWQPPYPLCYTTRSGFEKEESQPDAQACEYSGWIFEKCLPLCIISPSSVMMKKRFLQKLASLTRPFRCARRYISGLGSLPVSYLFINRNSSSNGGGHPDQLSQNYGKWRSLPGDRPGKHLSNLMSIEEREWFFKEMKKNALVLYRGFRKREGRRWREDNIRRSWSEWNRI